MTDSSQTAVLVFSRAPVAGETKRRLIPALGPAYAAELHERMLEAVVRSAVRAAVGGVTLCCTPNTEHACFTRLQKKYGLSLREQSTGDLGAKMHAAFDAALRRVTRAIVVGSDCPSVTPDVFLTVSDALAGDTDAVIIPATDGGYVLLGLRRLDSRLFEEIEWGSANVAQSTVERLSELGWPYLVLEPRRDIDRPEDAAAALQTLNQLELADKNIDKTAN